MSLAEGRKLYEQHVARPRVTGGVRKSTQKKYRSVLDKFLPFATSRGVTTWNGVTAELLNAYVADLEAMDYAHKTQSNELITLKQAVKWLIKQGHLQGMTEGPTDCAALLDLGFSAVGRPSCTGGVRHLVDLARALRPSEVAIIADGDAPGQRGAASLAAVLVAYCPAVRVATPPAGIKDARQWKQRGATAAGVAAVIDAAPVRRLAVTISRHRKAKAGRHGRLRTRS